MKKSIAWVMYFRNPDNMWFNMLVIVAFLFVIIALWQIMSFSQKEGLVILEEDSSYSFKQGSNGYDDFYADMYDHMVSPELCAEQVQTIIQNTQSSPKSSVILDIGSCKGQILKEFKNRGYENVYGIDSHEAMVRNTDIEVKDQVVFGDPSDMMNFDRNLFSHILCLNQSLYDIPDLSVFFQNCRFWLKQSGSLVLHLVQYHSHNNKLNPINMQLTPNIQYVQSLEISEESVVIQETFTDQYSRKVRQQEKSLNYKDIDYIVNLANYYGFSVYGKAQVSSKIVPDGTREYLYFFILA